MAPALVKRLLRARLIELVHQIVAVYRAHLVLPSHKNVHICSRRHGAELDVGLLAGDRGPVKRNVGVRVLLEAALNPYLLHVLLGLD